MNVDKTYKAACFCRKECLAKLGWNNAKRKDCREHTMCDALREYLKNKPKNKP